MAPPIVNKIAPQKSVSLRPITSPMRPDAIVVTVSIYKSHPNSKNGALILRAPISRIATIVPMATSVGSSKNLIK